MIYYALSVLIVSLSCIYAQKKHYQFISDQQDHKDNAKLSEFLETKIKEMDDLKQKMSHLLIKHGLMKS